MICGVDEAGRGPVIGPLVVAAVMVDDDAVLRSLRVKDSKQLSPRRREELALEIRKRARVEVEIIEAAQLDEMMAIDSLNDIEVKAFASLISSLMADVVYADACDVDARRFSRRIRGHLSYHPKMFCEHKADERYPVVSAASIIAKTVRDRRVREIEEELGQPIGSGYAHDEISLAFLEKWIKEKGDVPPHTRRTWETAKRKLSVSKTSKLTDWE
ncbi:MAG: ribonuclease HII [Methanomassiliicoccales archaeon]|jgi:ribonuclease HII|nr:ribonuclease HII [Methanomassiliicoccales archaeon]